MTAPTSTTKPATANDTTLRGTNREGAVAQLLMRQACGVEIPFRTQFALEDNVQVTRQAMGRAYTGFSEHCSFQLILPDTRYDPDTRHINAIPPANAPEMDRRMGGSFLGWGGGRLPDYPTDDPDAICQLGRVFIEGIVSITEATSDTHFQMALESEPRLFGLAPGCQHELRGWVDRVLEWVELRTGQVAFPDRREERREDGIIQFADLGEFSASQFGSMLWAYPLTGEPATAATLEDACARVSAGERVPRSWRLLARANHWRDASLKAIDACTAAEMAVWSRYEQEVAARAASGTPVEPKTANGLPAKLKILLDLLQRSGADEFRREVKQKLADPRNEAVHGGVQLTDAVAKDALDMALRVIEYCTPKPPLH